MNNVSPFNNYSYKNCDTSEHIPQGILRVAIQSCSEIRVLKFRNSYKKLAHQKL